MITSILFATVGGGIIGLAASWLLISNGRIAGISGILGELLGPWDHDSSWQLTFLAGLIMGGATLSMFWSEAIAMPEGRSLPAMAAAGLLVGYGTRLGSGCTSGHGICGLTRFSARSLVATLTFMAVGFLAATVVGFME
jgi:uncharacterized protein